MVAKPVNTENTFKEYGRPDLRNIYNSIGCAEIEVIDAAEDQDSALNILLNELDLHDKSEVLIQSDAGSDFAVLIKRTALSHIVEKRQDARERYVRYAIETISRPFEIWRKEYDDGTNRLAYIGLFQGKNQMLVMVHIENGNILWNFMHSNAKRLNKQRNGVLVYGKAFS